MRSGSPSSVDDGCVVPTQRLADLVASQRELTNLQRVLDLIARGEPLPRTLATACRLLERRYEETRCTIVLADPEPTVGASPAEPGTASTADADADADGTTDTDTDTIGYPLLAVSGDVLGTLLVQRPVGHALSTAERRDMLATARLTALAVEHERTRGGLRRAAIRDPLTGLPNRAGFLERVEATLGRQEDPRSRVAVLFVDLDRFGQVNDSLGHTTGDSVLVEAARRIASAVGPDAVVGRYGGDDFTVLLAGAGAVEPEAAADAVLATLREPVRLRGGEFFLSASIGIAEGDGTVDAAGLVADADAAMYAARGAGLGRRARYDAALRREMLGRLTEETLLRRGIEHEEFHMLFQPILDLRTDRWSGVEALVRWSHPQHGVIGPDAFIPLAEETGLIVPLGELILDLAIRDAAALFRMIPERPDLYVAVNVSAVQLADPALTERVEAAIRTHGLPAAQLVVEVTESAVMHEPELAESILRALTELGVRVLIDDFGTGHSSIARLGDLPGAGVKIDQRFIRALGEDVDGGGHGGPEHRDGRATRVLAAIASLAHAHEHLVIAEGIETALALGTVADLGCEYGQGFHLAAPSREAELLGVLRAAPPLRTA